MLILKRQKIFTGLVREESLQKLSVSERNPDNRRAEVLYALQTVAQNPAKAKELVNNIEPVGFIGEMAEAVRVLSQFSQTRINSEEKAKRHSMLMLQLWLSDQDW